MRGAAKSSASSTFRERQNLNQWRVSRGPWPGRCPWSRIDGRACGAKKLDSVGRGAALMSKELKTHPAPTFEGQRKPSAAERAWEEKTLLPALQKTPDHDADFTTVSSYPIRRLYTEADLAHWNAERDLGFPGQIPYTRGIHPSMYRGKLWTMRQFAGFGAAEDTNA